MRNLATGTGGTGGNGRGPDGDGASFEPPQTPPAAVEDVDRT
jgi:hypothetical protein